MSDKTIETFIAGLTVVEQLLVNLTHLVSREYDDARGVRATLVEDIRFRLEALQRKPSRDTQALAMMALDHLDHLEPRIMGQDDVGMNH